MKHHHGWCNASSCSPRSNGTVILFFQLLLVAACLSSSTVDSYKTCKRWCSSIKDPWTTKCGWDKCSECFECPNNERGGQCQDWCSSRKKCKWKECDGCSVCTGPGVKTFEDMTNSLSMAENKWNTLRHSFRPANFHFSPAFLDWNNDGFLDYFYINHMRENPNKEWDFGISVASKNSRIGRRFKSISLETFEKTDTPSYNHDSHGVAFADMDNDGNLDLLVAVGGGRGKRKNRDKFDNLLFWGTDNKTLKGGRDAANDAGIECHNCRGRFMYVTDANRDGLLDVMTGATARVDDQITPGVMQFNQGNRTFSNNANMEEYANTIILTDADGDGYAQEYVVFRTSCFRDPSKGMYSSHYKAFCETRPDKTTAVYKYMGEGNTMTMISPRYLRFADDNKFVEFNGEGAVDSATGDFDHDQRADLVVLFQDKLVIYHSSNRKFGDLPLYNEDGAQQGFVEMKLPCPSPGVAIRVADLDNDGEPELVLACTDPGEIYVLEVKGHNETVAINKRWNLGDVAKKKRWAPTTADLKAACVDGVVRGGVPQNWDYHCRNFKSHGGPGKTKLGTFSLMDLNNDGFLDIVAAHSIGYQRFFLSIPKYPQNHFLRFELKCTSSNVYGIGATLLFKASGLKWQFHEISSHGHGNSASGQVDNRIVFGLGQKGVPKTLIVRWPTGKKQTVDLSDIGKWRISNFDNPVVVTEE